MKNRIAAAALVALSTCVPIKAVRAQVDTHALVVTSCGNAGFPLGTSVNPTYEPLTMLANGNLCVNGGSGGGYTGATATAPGTSGSSATPVQGVTNGVPLAVTWTGQTISGTVTANQGAPASTANAWPTTDTNAAQTIAAAGSSSTKAQAVQSPAGGALALDASVQAVKTALGSPFQAGGSIGNTSFGISGTLPAFAATPTFNLGTLNGAATAANQNVTAAGTSATSAQGFQGVTGGVPVPSILSAGTAIAGKFGIDQTSQGVTNAVGNQGVYLTTPPTLTNGQWFGIQLTASGAQKTTDSVLSSIAAGAGGNAGAGIAIQGLTNGLPVPVSAAALPLPAGASTAANQPTNVAQASTTSGQTGTLAMAAVIPNTTTYTNGQSAPIGLNAQGALRTGIYQIFSGSLTAPTAGAIAQPQIDSAAQWKISETGSADPLVGITPQVATSATSLVGKAAAGNLYGSYAILTAAGSAQTYLVAINASAVPANGAAITPVDVAVFPSNAVGAQATLDYKAGPPNGYSTGIVILDTTSLTTYTPGPAAFMQARVR